jgi:hypothetical protein
MKNKMQTARSLHKVEIQHCMQKVSEMQTDYLSRNMVEAIKVSYEDLAEKQNNAPLGALKLGQGTFSTFNTFY